MRIKKLNVVKDIDDRDFPRWKQMGYKEISGTQKPQEKTAVGPGKQPDK